MKIQSRKILVAFVSAAVLCGIVGSALAWGKPPAPVPDLTQGGEKDDKHDWNLGPTGARGWIWGRLLETTDARQILITEVDDGSPADGVLAVGDVILGVDGKPFTEDARKRFGRAITEAEKEENGGILRLIRWRDGKQEDVQVKLAVMGSYSVTSPWDCPKSRKILDTGCRRIAESLKGGIDGKMNVLALSECLKILQTYGGAAKPIIPQLRELEKRLQDHREARGLKPQIDLVRQTIATIEADEDPPPLRRLSDMK